MGRILYDDTTEDVLFAFRSEKAQTTLALKVVARDMGISEDVLAQRIERLKQLLPHLSEGAIKRMKVATLVRLAGSVESVAEQLLAIKMIVPGADVARMACIFPRLLTLSPKEVLDRVEKVRHLLAGASEEGVMRVLQECPEVLDVEALERAVGDLQRMYKGREAGDILQGNPQLFYAIEPLNHVRNDFEDVAADLWQPPKGHRDHVNHAAIENRSEPS